MWFDPYAALARIQSEDGEAATQEGQSGPHVAEVAAPHSQNEKPQLAQVAPIEPTVRPPNQGPVPDKVSVGGRPVTWTGKVVSLDEWRRLTDWERLGPEGKVWNGKTQQWEQSNG